VHGCASFCERLLCPEVVVELGARVIDKGTAEAQPPNASVPRQTMAMMDSLFQPALVVVEASTANMCPWRWLRTCVHGDGWCVELPAWMTCMFTHPSLLCMHHANPTNPSVGAARSESL
jgi:hypothetical protein